MCPAVQLVLRLLVVGRESQQKRHSLCTAAVRNGGGPQRTTLPFDAPLTEPHRTMFGIYSDRLGCLGSIVASVVGTVVLYFLFRLLAG
jgi:hypothetical protein